jgi:hypothetical protein
MQAAARSSEGIDGAGAKEKGHAQAWPYSYPA